MCNRKLFITEILGSADNSLLSAHFKSAMFTASRLWKSELGAGDNSFVWAQTRLLANTERRSLDCRVTKDREQTIIIRFRVLYIGAIRKCVCQCRDTRDQSGPDFKLKFKLTLPAGSFVVIKFVPISTHAKVLKTNRDFL